MDALWAAPKRAAANITRHWLPAQCATFCCTSGCLQQNKQHTHTERERARLLISFQFSSMRTQLASKSIDMQCIKLVTVSILFTLPALCALIKVTWKFII